MCWEYQSYRLLKATIKKSVDYPEILKTMEDREIVKYVNPMAYGKIYSSLYKK